MIDPTTYAQQPVCPHCGCDPDGNRWPNCVEWSRATGMPRSEACSITCQQYWGKGGEVCTECETWIADTVEAETASKGSTP